MNSVDIITISKPDIFFVENCIILWSISADDAVPMLKMLVFRLNSRECFCVCIINRCQKCNFNHESGQQF